MSAISVSHPVLKAFEGLTPDPSWAFMHLRPSETNYATHGYHRYPAKFIPQLAERLILTYSREGDWVVDPFMGSGTTLVEAKKLRRPSLGVDINPVAHLVTQAKIRPIEPFYLRERVALLFERIRTIGCQPSLFAEVPAHTEQGTVDLHERIDYWFAPEIKQALWHIHRAIEQEPDEQVRTFFRCAFSNSLKPCSYWSNRSVKPLRQLHKPLPNPLTVFRVNLYRMVKGNRVYYQILQENDALQIEAQAYCRDARSLPLETESATLIVTSPPYVTSYEYADLHQLTVLWYQYASDLRTFRPQFIGTSAVNGEAKSVRELGSELAKQLISTLAERNPKKAHEVAVYFSEMRACFQEMVRVLREGGHACIVIGNTALEKVPILNAQVFAEQMAGLGMALEQVILREIPSKILPTTRESATGKFAKVADADAHAYPQEYILVFRKGLRKHSAG